MGDLRGGRDDLAGPLGAGSAGSPAAAGGAEGAFATGSLAAGGGGGCIAYCGGK